MNALVTSEFGMNWIIVLLLVTIILLVVCGISVFLLKDSMRRQHLYERFSGNLNEFIVVFSQKMEFLYGLPMYMSDPLFKRLSSGSSFQDLQDPKDWARMTLFFDDVEKHQNVSFIFSINLPKLDSSQESSGIQWYEMRAVVEHISVQETDYVCFIRNITKENENRKERERLQSRLDNLLQNTGDFLWNFEVEDRKFRLLTPLLDEEHRVIPQSTGYVNVHEMMPEPDWELLNAMLNRRVKNFHTFGSRGDPFESIKLRLYGPEKTLVWYSFRGSLTTDERNNLVFQGSARRMDMFLENAVLNAGDYRDSMFSAMFMFPDIRVFWVDPNYIVRGCNQAFVTDFQIMSPNDAIGKCLDAVVNQQALPMMMRALTEVFDTGRSVSWKGFFGNIGKGIMYNMVPIKGANGETVFVLGVSILFNQYDFEDHR
ncbi:hypothetical protein [uncultured Fibrobacter sp.]|uniref:hypothetical protein n=1 Tax=uncultured Fibrobacter sp. TaxID=261512 RepID=UPI0025F7AA18|nr:hypothetical protein [uncultured Fibrobacter sp.]